MSILKVLRDRTELLNVAELAKLLKVTEDTVQRWGRKRLIPCIRVGDTIRFDPGMLADWVEIQGACTHPIIRPFLHPRAPGNPDDFQMRWQNLGELVPVEVPESAKEVVKTEGQ